MFGGDNEIGNMLQEAVKIKSAQMGQKRKVYETWPYFVQHTLFHGEKGDFKAWRQLPFAEKIVLSNKLKDEGNDFYAKGNWSDAVDKYEEAGTLIHYCYSTDPGWRKNNRGIDDDVIVLVVDKGETPEEEAQYNALRKSCSLNLAQCKLNLQKYDEAVASCDVALEIEPTNVKALYRRAEARVRPAASTAYNHDMAIKDLARAHELDPSEKKISVLLEKLRGERKLQRGKDRKTFEGMFDRGQIYDKIEEEQANAKSSGGAGDPNLQAIQQRIDNISDDDTLEKRVADAELLRDLYMRNGKEDEAKELNEKIQVAKKACKDRDQPTSLDWANPTEEMIKDAKQYDLDLTDPLVIEELKRLEREGLTGANGELEDMPSGSGGLGASRSSTADGSVDLPLPEAEVGPPVPWARYVVLFFIIFVAFKFIANGTLRWFLVGSWRNVIGRAFVSGDADVERGSAFEAAYSKISGLFGGDTGDREL